MKKFSKKGILLFAGAMAICAFVLPSVASASSWGPLNTHHVLDSPNIGFTSVILGAGATSSCTSSSFTARVLSTSNLSISTGTFGGHCTATGAAIGTCTVTTTTTGFPWSATAVTTSNIQLSGVNVDILFENAPGLGSSCTNVNGAKLNITGTLSGGNWTGNAVHALDFNNSEGLVSHSALGNGTPITTRGSFTDTTNNLTVTG